MVKLTVEKNQDERSRAEQKLKKSKLFTINYRDKQNKIDLRGYADTLVYDKENANTIISLRFGGYPEHVQGLTDAIYGGATISITKDEKSLLFNCSAKNYVKSVIRNGPYAESTLAIKDAITVNDKADTKENEAKPVSAARVLYLMTEADNLEQLYEKIDEVIAVPLIPEFRKYLISELQLGGHLRKVEVVSLRERFDAWRLKLEAGDQNIIEIIENGLKSGSIAIPNTPENPNYSIFQSIDSVSGYLNSMGIHVAARIKNQFNPLFDPSKEPVSKEAMRINQHIKKHAGYSLYDAQLAAAEAIKRGLDIGKTVNCVAECGSGKSKIGSTGLSAYQMTQHKKAFNVVLCPSHLTGKWVRELKETVPNVFAVHIKSITEFHKAYDFYKKHDRNSYIIINKEKARDGYMTKPSVLWNARKKAFLCPHCYEPVLVDVFGEDGKYKEPAGAGFFKKENSKNHKCKNCNAVLWSALAPEHQSQWVKISNFGFIHRKHAESPFLKLKKDTMIEYAKSERRKQQRRYREQSRDLADELAKQESGEAQEPLENQEVLSDQETMVTQEESFPDVALDIPQSVDEIIREIQSMEIDELEKTIDFPKAYYDMKQVYEDPEGNFIASGAYRRFALSTYIKKKHKRIDGLIVDELQEYNNDSAQGQAFFELKKCAKKTVGLTGTLINGYSQGVFHLFYRTCPHLMQQDRKEYTDAAAFNSEYGVTESVYEAEDGEYNSNRRTLKRKIRDKQLPGVSPLVYPRFLMDSTVFLSLNDMGKDLPEYEEIPVELELEPQVMAEYKRIENTFIDVMKYDWQIKNRVMSAFMSLLTVYPDQPYGMKEIIDPIRGNTLIEPLNTSKPNVYNAKDRWILDKVKEKVAQGGRVVIYTSWISIDTQDKLTKLFKENSIQSVVLKSRVPTVKREKWVEDKVKDGIQVLITNPELLQTGLDLNDFPTLIYYNISYKLFPLRQSSRRSWRINQKEPRVEVYFLYFTNVIQERALRLMASKMAVAGIIEGNFSDEGLAAMSDCQDLTTLLAQELTSGIKNEVEDLGSLFKSMAILKPEGEAAVADASSEEINAEFEMPEDEYVGNEPIYLERKSISKQSSETLASKPAPKTLITVFGRSKKPRASSKSNLNVMDNQIDLFGEIASA